MSRSAVATDNFNRAALGTDWAQLNSGLGGTVSISGSTQLVANFGTQPTDQKATIRWVGSGTFNADQYSSVRLVDPLTFGGSAQRVGVCVRASADADGAKDYYEAYVIADSATTPTTRLVKWVNGTRTDITGGAQAWAANDLLSLEVEGTTLRVCRNGTALGGLFTSTDTDLASGQPGVVVGADSVFVDDWEGGNLVTVQPPPPATPTIQPAGGKPGSKRKKYIIDGKKRYLNERELNQVIEAMLTKPEPVKAKAKPKIAKPVPELEAPLAAAIPAYPQVRELFVDYSDALKALQQVAKHLADKQDEEDVEFLLLTL